MSSPTYTGEGGHDFDHTALVTYAASIEAFGAWPFEADVIAQTGGDRPFS